MDSITLIATTSFGLEKVVKREVNTLGFEILRVSDGKVEFEATLAEIPKANLWLRCAERVLLKMGEFAATTFDELFEQSKALPWENWITQDGKFTITGHSVKSTLRSVRACQSIVKKAVVERLKEKYQTDWFEETGPSFTIKVSLLRDIAVLTLDTTGPGLNKRGYRKETGKAPLKETLAAALVMLSFWNRDRLLIDPMCGSGTILIEAAMIARNIAPGLKREFASEKWPAIYKSAWRRARREARKAIDSAGQLRILGYDIDESCIQSSKVNAKNAGVADDIVFEQQDVRDLWIDQQYGIVISNPPYGVKIGGYKDINQIYISINKTFRKKTGWSLYVLTADPKFPSYFKRSQPDRIRRLFNGPIKANYYQYYGERPKDN